MDRDNKLRNLVAQTALQSEFVWPCLESPSPCADVSRADNRVSVVIEPVRNVEALKFYHSLVECVPYLGTPAAKLEVGVGVSDRQNVRLSISYDVMPPATESLASVTPVSKTYLKGQSTWLLVCLLLLLLVLAYTWPIWRAFLSAPLHMS